MNRRDFLRLAAVTAAAAVAGLRPRPEPGEMVTVPHWVTSPEIVMTDYGRITTNATGVSWAALREPAGIISPTVTERYRQLIELGLGREQAYMQAVIEEYELQCA